MTQEQLKDLAATYRQLLDFKPFQLLVKEMVDKVEEFKESNINNDDNDLRLKGMVSGMRYVISEPENVIAEFENSQTRE